MKQIARSEGIGTRVRPDLFAVDTIVIEKRAAAAIGHACPKAEVTSFIFWCGFLEYTKPAMSTCSRGH
jgi:hypothetical protein